MRKCDKEFKEEAVNLSDEVGVKQAVGQSSMPYYSLVAWHQKRRACGDHAFVGSGIRRDAPLSENERRLLRKKEIPRRLRVVGDGTEPGSSRSKIFFLNSDDTFHIETELLETNTVN